MRRKFSNQPDAPMKRILIVDDQQEIRELVRLTLEIGGYEVHEADNGDNGLQVASRVVPDLVLLDLMMPGGLDGLAVCRRIRAEAATRRTKVVMLSGRSQPADEMAGLEAGADAYLTKPFSPRQLLQVVSQMV
jgi:DNA-binding response OmpR family regulator